MSVDNRPRPHVSQIAAVDHFADLYAAQIIDALTQLGDLAGATDVYNVARRHGFTSEKYRFVDIYQRVMSDESSDIPSAAEILSVDIQRHPAVMMFV